MFSSDREWYLTQNLIIFNIDDKKITTWFTFLEESMDGSFNIGAVAITNAGSCYEL